MISLVPGGPQIPAGYPSYGGQFGNSTATPQPNSGRYSGEPWSMPASLPEDIGHLPKTVAEANREHWKETGVAQVVIVACFECSKILLEGGILINRLTANRCWEVGIAGGAGEGHSQVWLVHILKAHLHRDAEVASVARDQIAEAETKTRRNLTKVDASRAAQRITVAADVILAIQRNCAA